MRVWVLSCCALVAAIGVGFGSGCSDSSPYDVYLTWPEPRDDERDMAAMEHWAFKAPSDAAPPSNNGDWGNNEIDAFVAQHLGTLGIAPAPQASPEKLLRRVSLALTGLPPTVEELDAFLADPSDEAYAAVVDRLLASPRYAEHMLAGWLDLGRYADTDGYQYDYRRPAWPWRDWTLQALDANMPFDEFTTKQLAGDLLPSPSEQDLLATSFNRNHPIQGENGLLKDEFRDRYVADRVDTLSRAWLGLTVGCARCHDHKYDPTTANDYYRLYDCFNQVPESDNGPESDFAPSMEIASPLRSAVTSDLGERMETREADGASKYELEWLQYEADVVADAPLARIMRDETDKRVTRKLAVGRYDAPFGDPLVCSAPSFLPPFPEGAPADRMGLSQWLLSRDNPLTARVVVNRMWHEHFGRGLVATVDNFGVQIEAPEYLDLLDWLAIRFIESGWDLKAMHRLIVTSSTFKQSSDVTEALLAEDQDNVRLARGPHFRLPAEVIRDLALSASGLLVDRMGGPSVYPYQPVGVWEDLAWEGDKLEYPVVVGDGLYRRSVYTFWKRTLPPPFMSLFDAPDREQSVAVREPSRTAEQALALMNGTQFLEAARHLAADTHAETQGDIPAAMNLGFRKLTSRLPNEREQELLASLYQQQQETLAGTPAAVDPLQRSGRSSASKVDAELAALTQVMRVLLNLGETVSQE